MLKDKNIEDIKKLLGEDGFKIEKGKAYAKPESAFIIPQLVKLATQGRFKILPLGNGSRIDSLKFSEDETLFLKLNRLSHIKKIVPQDLFMVVEPGLNLIELNSQLSAYNLFYPLSQDNSTGTIGGSVASGLSAKTGAKEISTKELVLALEMVDSSGQNLKLGSEVFKSVTGYDTPRLLVGSWGTLGVITSVSLRAFPLNRKKEFANLKILPSTPGKLKGEDDPRTILNRNIKKLLDPEGVFVELG